MSSDTEDNTCIRRRVSVVWKYFEKLSKDRIRCRLCHHEQNYQGTTGNLLRHLKNKHNVDASSKGQVQHSPKDTKILKLKSTKPPEENVKAESSSSSRKSQKNELFEEYIDIDPYEEATIQNLESYLTENDVDQANIKKSIDNKQEDRLLAEIEYYKEKAGFYRMQKNLISLQVRKIKSELEKLTN